MIRLLLDDSFAHRSEKSYDHTRTWLIGTDCDKANNIHVATHTHLNENGVHHRRIVRGAGKGVQGLTALLWGRPVAPIWGHRYWVEVRPHGAAKGSQRTQGDYMASFKFEIYSNIQVYGSVEVEADSFQEAAKKFDEQSKSNLCEIDWDERSYDYDSGAVVDRITCDDYKPSPDSEELDEEVLVEMPGGGVPIGEFKLADVLDLVQRADASLLNQQLEQDTASASVTEGRKPGRI